MKTNKKMILKLVALVVMSLGFVVISSNSRTNAQSNTCYNTQDACYQSCYQELNCGASDPNICIALYNHCVVGCSNMHSTSIRCVPSPFDPPPPIPGYPGGGGGGGLEPIQNDLCELARNNLAICALNFCPGAACSAEYGECVEASGYNNYCY